MCTWNISVCKEHIGAGKSLDSDTRDCITIHSFITDQLWSWASEITLSQSPSPRLLNEKDSFPCLPHSTEVDNALRGRCKLSRSAFVFGLWRYPPVLVRGQIFCKKCGWWVERRHTMPFPSLSPSATCKATDGDRSKHEGHDLCKDEVRFSSCFTSVFIVIL